MTMTYGNVLNRYCLQFNGKLDPFNPGSTLPFELYKFLWMNDGPEVMLEDPKTKIWAHFSTNEIKIAVPSVKMALIFLRDERWDAAPATWWRPLKFDGEMEIWEIDPEGMGISFHSIDEEIEEKLMDALLAPWNE